MDKDIAAKSKNPKPAETAIKVENACPADYAIKVSGVSKTFRIPHEKISTIRGAFVNLFRTNGYEEFEALDNVSFEVKKGEFFGIIGRNGSGKSTLLKVLAGIYQTDSGKVKVNGRISPFLELGIGFNPELSGRDNVYLNATVLGLTHQQIDERFDDIVRFSELKRFIDQKVKNFSSGMMVRLAFSVAIHANRDILLMDEVLAVGDSNFQSKCLEEFSRYRDLGKTVVLVSHDILTVQKYCDRVMLMREGKIHMIGSPEKVGNEYIYQNMSDEEKRLVEEEKERRIKAQWELEKRRREEEKERKEKTEEELREQRKAEEERRRLEAEEEKKAEEERRRRMAKITRVEFLDKNGNKKNVFQTGDDMSVRVYFKQKKDVKDLNFGLTIHNLENNYLFGINTYIDKIDIEKCKKNKFFQIDIHSIPFKTNSYFVKVGLFGQNEAKNYDFLEKSEIFRIVSTSKSHGSVEVKYSW